MTDPAMIEQTGGLLCCPFCGKAPEAHGSGEGQRGLMIDCITPGCVNPHVSYYDHASAKRVWNTRAPSAPAPVQGVVEALSAVVRFVGKQEPDKLPDDLLYGMLGVERMCRDAIAALLSSPSGEAVGGEVAQNYSLVLIRNAVVMAMAFLARDAGSDRAEVSTPQIIKALSNADAEVRRLLSEVRSAPAQAAWLPISTAPKDGTPFLGYLAGLNVPYFVCWWSTKIKDGQPYICILGIGEIWDHKIFPTHWQPLNPPKAEGGGK